MNTLIVEQDYFMYTPEDHRTWSILSERQRHLRNGKVSQEYLNGFNKLQFDEHHVMNIPETSAKLQAITGWTLIPVTGLLPTKDFFEMLINKKYPITVYIRKPHELDFSEQPDIFHDVYGHIPLLANEKFVKFLLAYSNIAIKYANLRNAVELLGRLYWYTYETGIILEEGEYKPYGGAIITSAGELENTKNPSVPKYPFELEQVFTTAYNSFKLQKEYFVIPSFDELFNSIDGLEQKLVEHLVAPKQGELRNYSLNMPLAETVTV